MQFQKDHDAYYAILLNSKNYLSGSTFRYTFPAGSVDIKRSSIALESISMELSMFNITTAFNNRIFTIGFPEGNGNIIYNQVLIPEGNYNFNGNLGGSFNAWLQYWMISNNYYLIDDLGNYVYYVELLYNDTYGRIQLNLYDVPTTLPTGWTNPGWNLPTENTAFGNTRPVVVVGSANNFGSFIGFNADTYNDSSQLGQNAPQDPVEYVVVQCTNLDNKYSNPSTNLFQFSTKDSTISNNRIDVTLTECNYIDLTDGNVSYLDIRLIDQDNRELVLKSIDVKINLIIKVRENK